MAKQKVALDCLSYHASASQADTDTLAKADIPSAAKYSLHRYVILLYSNLDNDEMGLLMDSYL